jgi:phospholipid transport system substrate-binding protein
MKTIKLTHKIAIDAKRTAKKTTRLTAKIKSTAYCLLVACSFSLTLLPSVTRAEPAVSDSGQQAPKALIASTIDQITEIVGKYPKESESATRKKLLRELIEPHFDFKDMARRSLGTHWGKITQPQQTEFVDMFSNLLSKTYLSYLETVKPGMVKMLEEEIKTAGGANKVALVRTEVKHKGEVFPINYKLVQRTTGWKVYDIIIENIGLVSNYRSEFAGILRKNGFDGLMQKLRSK